MPLSHLCISGFLELQNLQHQKTVEMHYTFLIKRVTVKNTLNQ